MLVLRLVSSVQPDLTPVDAGRAGAGGGRGVEGEEGVSLSLIGRITCIRWPHAPWTWDLVPHVDSSLHVEGPRLHPSESSRLRAIELLHFAQVSRLDTNSGRDCTGMHATASGPGRNRPGLSFLLLCALTIAFSIYRSARIKPLRVCI